MSADGLIIFGCLFVGRKKISKIKFLLASLTTCENPSSNPLLGVCYRFPITACDSKLVPKATCDSENCSGSWP
jgi:hypothetical protein